MKDPNHSVKSAGGRLQLNTHAPYIYVALHEVTQCMCCTVYTERAENVRWQQFRVAPAMPAL